MSEKVITVEQFQKMMDAGIDVAIETEHLEGAPRDGWATTVPTGERHVTVNGIRVGVIIDG